MTQVRMTPLTVHVRPGIPVSARRSARALLTLAITLGQAAAVVAQTPARQLTVVSAGPQGEVPSLAETSEIRVVFSEPMVTLGQIPSRVSAPYFRVTPAIAGTFRWSGTTTLIFTPDPKRALPYATRYEVTIDGSATAVSGHRLGEPYRFSFPTPTVKLLNTAWYRRAVSYQSRGMASPARMRWRTKAL